MRNVFRYTKTTLVIERERPAHDAAPAPTRDSYLDIDGARLRYRVEGEGAFAVVFMHGWTLDLDMWEPQAAALSAAHRVVRFDRRGFGLSSGEPSLVADVADLHALCRHLRLQRIALVGMSQGARVALHFASLSAAMLSCLVLDGSPRIGDAHGKQDPEEYSFEEFRRLAQTHGMAAFRRAWMQHRIMKLNTGDVAAHELLARMIGRYPGRDLLTPLPRPSMTTTPAMIQSIAPPVLVIGGALDIDGRRRFADELTRELPRAERAEIPQAGHLCNLDNPRAYTAALQNFLEQHATAQTQH